MAFTDAEILTLSTIVGMTPTLLTAHLASLGSSLTSDVETAVRAEVTRWTTGAVGSETAFFTPTESNKGFNLRPADAQNSVKRNIRLLLEIVADGCAGGSVGTLNVARP